MWHRGAIGAGVAIGLLGVVALDAGAKGTTPHATAGGSGSAEKQDASPKITGVSPANEVIDQNDPAKGSAVEIAITGTDFPDGALTVTYDSDPAEHLVTLAGTRKSSTEVHVTLSAPSGKRLSEVIPVDVPLHFRVYGTKGSKPIASDASTATFTAHLPLFAREMCGIKTADGYQVRMRVPGVQDGARVFVGNAKGKEPCVSVQLFGVDQLVCFVPTSAWPPTWVQVLRKDEHQAAGPANVSGPANGSGCGCAS